MAELCQAYFVRLLCQAYPVRFGQNMLEITNHAEPFHGL